MRKGAAMLLVLILMGVSSMSLFFVLDTVLFQVSLIRNREIGIQKSFDEKENHLLNVVYKEIYLPYVIRTIPTALRSVNKIDTFKVENVNGEETTGKIELFYKGDEISYKCTITSSNSTSKTILKGRLLNEFVNDNFIINKVRHINHNNVNLEHLHIMRDFFDDIPGNFQLDNFDYLGDIIHVKDGEGIIIQGGSTNSSLKVIRQDGSSQGIKPTTSIIVESPDDKRTDLTLDIANFSSSRLNGLIYIENGDLIIKRQCYVDALVVIKNGRIIVDGAFTPSIKGLVITNDGINYSTLLSMEYSGEAIIRHGYLLPGFMNPTVDEITHEQ